jgi:hypothetical protein
LIGKPLLQRSDSKILHLRKGEPIQSRDGRTVMAEVYTNGMNCSEEDAIANAFASSLPNSDLYLCYNSTSGTTNDLGKVILNKMGIDIPPVTQLTRLLKNLCGEANSSNKNNFIRLIGHSQGGAINAQALTRLTTAQKANLLVETYGTAEIITKEDGVASADNYIGRSDPVPFLVSTPRLVKEVLKPSGAVHFVGKPGIPLANHAFLSPDYQEAVSRAKKKYRTEVL